MRTGTNTGLTRKWAKIVALALAAGAAGAAATPAFAGDRRDERGRIERRLDPIDQLREAHRRHERMIDRHRDSPPVLDVEVRTGRIGRDRRDDDCYEDRRVRVWVPAVYRTVCDRVWVEPEYRTVCERVWHEPIVRTECERVWVPARYEERWVTRVDYRGCRVRVCERVCVEPGHYEERKREVVVRAGTWEMVERRELVCEGRWKNVERQELVCDGHYEWRSERVRVADRGGRGSFFAFGLNID
jgi:hypothetical protein